MLFEDLDGCALLCVPKDNLAVLAAGEEKVAVVVEDGAVDGALVLSQFMRDLPRAHTRL